MRVIIAPSHEPVAYLVITACLIAATAAYGAGDRVESVKQVPAAAPDEHYISNRAPLATSPLVKLPVGAIRPEGWLRGQLEVQADGFIGRLTEISAWCRAADNAWLSKEGTGTLPVAGTAVLAQGLRRHGLSRSITAQRRKTMITQPISELNPMHMRQHLV